MTIIPLSDFLSDQQFFITEAQKEKIFVYPTDTIYGIGGIVTPTVVEKINTIKQRTAGKHYSIIAPNNEWVEERFELEAVSGCNGFEETWKTLHKKH